MFVHLQNSRVLDSKSRFKGEGYALSLNCCESYDDDSSDKFQHFQDTAAILATLYPKYLAHHAFPYPPDYVFDQNDKKTVSGNLSDFYSDL